MAWTYSLALTDAKDQVRLLVGDTDSSDPQLQDEEITYYVTSQANTYMAASRCAMALVARYSRKADKAVGDLKITYAKVADRYQKLADTLKSQGMTHQIPTAGGIKVTDTQAYEQNTGIRHSAIKRGMTDYVAPTVLPNTEGN